MSETVPSPSRDTPSSSWASARNCSVGQATPTVWAFRYSSEGRSRSLFYSTKLHTLRQLYPDNPILHQVSEETRLVVSEPLGDLTGAWNEVPESSYGVVHHGHDELHPFRPRSGPAVVG